MKRPNINDYTAFMPYAPYSVIDYDRYSKALDKYTDSIELKSDLLHNVSKRELLNDILINQEEIISSPIRFNGVSIEKLKQIFEKNGVEYEIPF